MLYFPLKLSLYREGNKLWYMTEIATILQKRGKMHEVFLAEKLIESGKRSDLFNIKGGIKTKGTAWGYINNAVSLGIVRSEGTWKGTIRARVFTLTCLGEALSLIEQVNGKRLDFPKLNTFEKILFLKRLMELDDLWDGKWISCILAGIPENRFKNEKEIIQEVSQTIPQLKNLKLRTKEHRIFPRLQWLIDLGLIEAEKIGKDKARKVRSYRSTQLGHILKSQKSQSRFLGRYYGTIAEIYNLKRKIDIDSKKAIMQIFSLLRSQLESPLVPIPLFRYIFCTMLLLRGVTMEESDFDDLILDFAKNHYFQLHQSPYKTFEPEIIDGKRYYYLSRD